MTTDGQAEESVETEVPNALRRYAVEAGLGMAIGAALLFALVASTGEIPFVYQGY